MTEYIQYPARFSSTHVEAAREGRALLPALLVVIALAFGVFVGVAWHDTIARLFRLDSREQTDAAGSAADAPAQLWTCGMHPQVIQDHPGTCPICGMQLTPMNAAGSGDGGASGIVTIDPAIVHNMGVRLAEVQRRPLHATIRAAGFLREADPNVHEINLRVSGWVERLYADTLGMTIARGQRLFDLYSPDLQSAIGELIASRRASAATPGAAGAAGGGLSGDVLLQAARRKLELFGLTADQIAALEQREEAPLTVTFRSNADGILAAKPIVEGASVKAGDMALQIVDYSTLWLDAQIFPQHIPHVREGQKVRATIEAAIAGARADAGSGEMREVEGEIIFISPQLDPSTRAIAVRMQVGNEDLSLRPGMWATARLERVVADDAIVVPREAIIDSGERQVAFIALDGGRFEPRDVRLGASGDDGQVQIVSGLAQGERVVVSGQFLIDSESRLREAIQKHMHGGAPSLAPSKPEDYAVKPISPQPAPSDAAAQWLPEIDAMTQAYLTIAEAFGAPQPSAQAIDTSALVQSAHALHASAGDEIRPLVETLAKAVDDFAAAPADGQRERFKPLSDAMIALAQRAPPSSAIADRLVVIHCPMAPGNWLQTVETIANPYYATEMKRCGEITGYIEATQTGGEGAKP